MKLTPSEKAMLRGAEGPAKARALEYLIQFGEAFGAKKLVDVSYVHVTSGHAYQKGEADVLTDLAASGARAAVPTTANTICTDLERPETLGTPHALLKDQRRVLAAHTRMGMAPAYTCAPYLTGWCPTKGACISTVESSAIIYYNSVLGARTNRGGYFTLFSALTGKYPLMGYLLDASRAGTHLIRVKAPLHGETDYGALGYHVGALVGSGVPVFDGLVAPTTEELIQLGAALATSGSVSLFHIPGVTAEANTLKDAFQGKKPQATFTVTARDVNRVYEKLTTAPNMAPDFILFGCPHATLRQIERVARGLEGRRLRKGTTLWVTTARPIKTMADTMGYTALIERAGGRVVCDTCPIESFLRKDVCGQYGHPGFSAKCLATDSAKQAKYAGNLLNCETRLAKTEDVLAMAVET